MSWSSIRKQIEAARSQDSLYRQISQQRLSRNLESPLYYSSASDFSDDELELSRSMAVPDSALLLEPALHDSDHLFAQICAFLRAYEMGRLAITCCYLGGTRQPDAFTLEEICLLSMSRVEAAAKKVFPAPLLLEPALHDSDVFARICAFLREHEMGHLAITCCYLGGTRQPGDPEEIYPAQHHAEEIYPLSMSRVEAAAKISTTEVSSALTTPPASPALLLKPALHDSDLFDKMSAFLRVCTFLREHEMGHLAITCCYLGGTRQPGNPNDTVRHDAEKIYPLWMSRVQAAAKILFPTPLLLEPVLHNSNVFVKMCAFLRAQDMGLLVITCCHLGGTRQPGDPEDTVRHVGEKIYPLWMSRVEAAAKILYRLLEREYHEENPRADTNSAHKELSDAAAFTQIVTVTLPDGATEQKYVPASHQPFNTNGNIVQVWFNEKRAQPCWNDPDVAKACTWTTVLRRLANVQSKIAYARCEGYPTPGLYVDEKGVLLKQPLNLSVDGVVVPYGVTAIEPRAFYDGANWIGGKLCTLTLPETLTIIGEQAFSSSSLTSLTLPDSLTAIGQDAFYKTRLKGPLKLPRSLTTIGRDAFYQCTLEGDLVLPDSLTYIGKRAFFRCQGLRMLKLSGETSKMTTICHGAFSGCRGLKGALLLPDSMTRIESEAFCDCEGLTAVRIPDSLVAMGKDAFKNCKGLTLNSKIGYPRTNRKP